jgi:hypothetical protein
MASKEFAKTRLGLEVRPAVSKGEQGEDVLKVPEELIMRVADVLQEKRKLPESYRETWKSRIGWDQFEDVAFKISLPREETTLQTVFYLLLLQGLENQKPISLDTWCMLTAKLANRMMNVENVCVLLCDESGKCFTPRAGIGIEPSNLSLLQITSDNRMVKFLEKTREILIKEELPFSLPKKEAEAMRKEMKCSRAEIAIPLFEDNQLVAIVTVGRKVKRGNAPLKPGEVDVELFKNTLGLRYDANQVKMDRILIEKLRTIVGNETLFSPDEETADPIKELPPSLLALVGVDASELKEKAPEKKATPLNREKLTEEHILTALNAVLEVPDLYARFDLRSLFLRSEPLKLLEKATGIDNLMGQKTRAGKPLGKDEVLVLNRGILESIYRDELANSLQHEEFDDNDMRVLCALPPAAGKTKGSSLDIRL